MIITSEVKNYAALGILTINTGSLVLAIYVLLKYVRSLSSLHQPLPHKFYFKNMAIHLMTLFHLMIAAIIVTDLVMAWGINTSNRIGYKVLMAMSVTEVAIMEMILVSLIGAIISTAYSQPTAYYQPTAFLSFSH